MGGIGPGVVVAGHVAPLGNHRGLHRQPGRVVVLIPLPDAPDDGKQDRPEHQNEHQRKHDLKSAEENPIVSANVIKLSPNSRRLRANIRCLPFNGGDVALLS